MERKNMDRLIEAVTDCFRKEMGQFREEDFIKVSGLLGFHAHKKTRGTEMLKPIGENYLPDLIGTKLNHAEEAFDWKTLLPMTDDGCIVCGFWDSSSDEEMPAGYEMASNITATLQNSRPFRRDFIAVNQQKYDDLQPHFL